MIEPGRVFHDDIEICGVSLAGIRTSLTIPQFSLGFDVAQGLPHALSLKHYLISHGHMDHAAGIPYIISQKAMNSQSPPDFFMPESLVEPMTKIMNLWSGLEGHEYSYNFVPMKAQTEIELRPGLSVKAFQTVHRIDSLGYTIYNKRKKLKKEFQGKAREQIIELRDQGVLIHDLIRTPLVSFTGDTQIEVLDQDEDLKKSKILLIECTYLDDQRPVERARMWGHTHLDELVPRLDELENELICLIHVSSRYSLKEAQKILSERIPIEHKKRVVLFPGR